MAINLLVSIVYRSIQKKVMVGVKCTCKDRKPPFYHFSVKCKHYLIVNYSLAMCCVLRVHLVKVL